MAWYEDYNVVEAKISTISPGPDTLIYMARLLGRLLVMPVYLIIKPIVRKKP